METKVFTTIPGPCPFGIYATIDSPGCRSCEYFYRTGTGTFFWCNHPPVAQKLPKIARKAPEIAQEKRKRGRPPGKAAKKPVKRLKKQK